MNKWRNKERTGGGGNMNAINCSLVSSSSQQGTDEGDCGGGRDVAPSTSLESVVGTPLLMRKRKADELVPFSAGKK